MKKRLFPLVLALLLLASCAAAPAEPWVPEETPEAREARILETAVPFDYTQYTTPKKELKEISFHALQRDYLCLLLTARYPLPGEHFGGAFIDEEAGRYVVYTTEDVWNGLDLNDNDALRYYYLEEFSAQIPIDLAFCDFSLAELGATARELEELALPGVLDIRVEPRQNRVAVYAESWSEKRQAEFEEKLAHPEHCAVTLDAPPDGQTVRFAEGPYQTDAPRLSWEAGNANACRVLETLYNAWWWLPAGSWERALCDQDPAGLYGSTHGRHTIARLYSDQEDPELCFAFIGVIRRDYSYTPAWETWGAEQEAFFRDLLAGLNITICHYDEGRNAIE